jgi:hypothetical protein
MGIAMIRSQSPIVYGPKEAVTVTVTGGTGKNATVGGFNVPVNKVELLAPYIGLTSTMLIATSAIAIYVKHVKRRKEKQ